jgi:hypothetical protein
MRALSAGPITSGSPDTSPWYQRLEIPALEALPAAQRKSANSDEFGTSAYRQEAGAIAAVPSTGKVCHFLT